MMKKIMILGAGVYQVPIIEAANARGLYTIVVSPNGDYPGLALADKVYDLDVRNESAILEAAQEQNIDGITTDQTDIAIRTVAYVAEKLGLPGIGYECARLFTDKSLMREKGRELGLPVIKSRSVASLEEAESFFSEINDNAIIKPVDSQGSRGVSKIANLADLKAKYKDAEKFSRDGTVIIEQFITGQEFEVDSIVVEGNAQTLMYADLESFELPDVFASTTRLYPSIADQQTVEYLLNLNKSTIEGFGLLQGLTHSEYIMDHTGEIYLIEAAARGGGTYISSHIAQLQTGLNTSDFLVDLALGDIHAMPEFQKNRCHCGYVTFYLPQGRVISIEGVQLVASMPFVDKHHLDNIKVDMQTEAFSDKTARYAIILSADSRKELLKRIDWIKAQLNIKVQTDCGIKGPIWN